MTIFVVIVAGVLVWNVFLAGQIAQLRRAPRLLAALTAIAGLLVAPAFLIQVTSSSLFSGRAVASVTWIWPLTTCLFVAQAAYATVRRLVTPFIGVPIFAYDVVVALTAIGGYLVHLQGTAPASLLALQAAQSSVLGTAIGRVALTSPLATLPSLLAPAYPARWRLSATVRATLAFAAAIGAALTLLELPRGYGAIASYQPYAAERLRERPGNDFAIGVKLLPDLDGAPSALAVRTDLALLDTINADVVSIRLNPGALRLAVLDSVAHVLDGVRRDSTQVIVVLGFDDGDGARLRSAPREFLADRLDLVERVARRIRPDYLLPAGAPYGDAAAALGTLPLTFWREELTQAARRAHAINRRIRVGIMAAAYDAADSALYAWAASPTSPLDAVGFAVHPSFNGAGGVEARLRAADRWARAEPTAPGRRRKEHWIFEVSAYPAAHGDVSQDRTIWRTIAWATNHPQFAGVIAAESGDYATTTGLRASTGRLRPSVTMIRRAMQALAEGQ